MIRKKPKKFNWNLKKYCAEPGQQTNFTHIRLLLLETTSIVFLHVHIYVYTILVYVLRNLQID